VAKFNVGDLVVLKSGSMRMCVEECTDDSVSTIWCNEGIIGRDTFNPVLMNKWEVREDAGGGRSGPRGGDRDRGGDRGGDRGAKPPYRGGGDRDKGGDDRPPRKTGWDGKPRDKKYFRKEE
jgi:uncharacterized protein YodC (DUF2158 family)